MSNSTRISVVVGDITEQEVDAVVNAANEKLLPGGGVDGAIHRAAGPGLREECLTLGGCKPGEAKITKGYNLKAKFVIHTVGPIYGQSEGRDAEILASCYRNSLILAKEHGIRSIAFPAISTGSFGYPIAEAGAIARSVVEEFLAPDPEAPDVRFVVLSSESVKHYEHR